jgi:hypothetical protein
MPVTLDEDSDSDVYSDSDDYSESLDEQSAASVVRLLLLRTFNRSLLRLRAYCSYLTTELERCNKLLGPTTILSWILSARLWRYLLRRSSKRLSRRLIKNVESHHSVLSSTFSNFVVLFRMLMIMMIMMIMMLRVVRNG